MLAAVIAGAGALDRISRRERNERHGARIWIERGALIGIGVLATVAIALPLASTEAINNSERAYRAGQLGSALTDARTAARVQPYAATPLLQEAVILEVQGRFAPATAAAREAVRAESTNWRTWFILSRLQARKGNADAAVRAYRRAKALGAPFS
jgi:Flp pilus assembly protein TadD